MCINIFLCRITPRIHSSEKVKRKALAHFYDWAFYSCKNISQFKTHLENLLLENHRAYSSFLRKLPAIFARLWKASSPWLDSVWLDLPRFRAIHDSRETERSRVYTSEKPRGKDSPVCYGDGESESAKMADGESARRGKLKFMNVLRAASD